MDNSCINIAIANGHSLVRDSISRALAAEARFNIYITAGNGRDLIDAIATAPQLPDVCVLDVQMQEMNGYETMDILHERWPELKVLVLSALDDDFAVKTMLNLGAISYLGKDSSMQELQKALFSIHKTGNYYSAIMSRVSGSEKDKQLCIDEQEYAYLKYCHTEMTAKEIAGILDVSPAAVNSCRRSLFGKLKVSTRQGLAIFALKTGIIALGDVKAGSRSSRLPVI